MLAEHSSTTLTNNSLNASSAGTSRKLYEDELDPSEDYINECEMSSGIQMMTFRSNEAKGNFAPPVPVHDRLCEYSLQGAGWPPRGGHSQDQPW